MRHDAVGWRIRVFWPAMGRWYQGKVKDYDTSTGTPASSSVQKGLLPSLRLCSKECMRQDQHPATTYKAFLDQPGAEQGYNLL